MKICKNCKLLKPKTDFFKRQNSKDGLQHYCKECKATKFNQHYENNKKHYLNKAQKTRKLNKDIINESKNKPCMDCGKSYPYYVMDFDHRNPDEKLFDLGNYTKFGIKQIKEEIAKCDVVCANCHRIRTYKI